MTLNNYKKKIMSIKFLLKKDRLLKEEGGKRIYIYIITRNLRIQQP